GKVLALENGEAVLDTPMGRLRGRNARNLKVGEDAVLFVRPEAFRLGAGINGSTLQAPVLNVAFEGNMSHIFLKGPTRKDIVVSVGRGGPERMPGKGETASIQYDREAGLVLPVGKLASD